ncbi:MAG: hypothetical protein AAB011_05995 [Candidatus Eisenbacteria bacterium]
MLRSVGNFRDGARDQGARRLRDEIPGHHQILLPRAGAVRSESGARGGQVVVRCWGANEAPKDRQVRPRGGSRR